MQPSKPLAIALLIGALAATAVDAKPPQRHGPERGLDSLNQPVVQRTDYVMDLAGGYDGLPTVEQGRLRGWFNGLGLGYGDRVWVDGPLAGGEAGNDVARVAAEYGLLILNGAPITSGQVEPDSVRVIVSRSTASVPNCPRADKARGASATSSNYGCAVNSNLAAMIADPSDLVLGQAGSGTGDATTAAKAIKVYRETPPTGTKGLQALVTRGGSN